MHIGDFLVEGGSPGHAVIVMDIAEDKTSGRKIFLLAQGFMPAQEMHILKNPMSGKISPWYALEEMDTIRTPEWDFKWKHLRRMPK